MLSALFRKKDIKIKKALTEKINFNNGLICEIMKDKTCIIIDEMSNKTISTLKFKHEIISVICLDNKDIFFEEEKNGILAYRNIKDKYSLFQKIDNTQGKYKDQEVIYFYGCTGNDKYKKKYEFYGMHKISGNRFILCSNYGLKFYGLKEESKEYEIIYEYAWNYINVYFINSIEEINPNEYVIKATILVGTSMLGPSHFEEKTYSIRIDKEDQEEEEIEACEEKITDKELSNDEGKEIVENNLMDDLNQFLA